MTTVTDEVVDVAEAVAEQAMETLVVVRQNRYLLAGCALAGLVVGGLGGFLITKKKLELYYVNLAQYEINEAKDFYQALAAANDKPATPGDLLKERVGDEALAALREYKGEGLRVPGEAPAETEEELQVGDVVVETNVFISDSDSTWDYETEYAQRIEFPDQPYILSKQEFIENQPEHEQVTMTYFEGDDTLVDERDMPVMDTDGVVGDDNLPRFGHGSEDKNVIYIRNERIEADYEIVRHTGTFAESLGFQHSDTPSRSRRHRESDD